MNIRQFIAGMVVGASLATFGCGYNPSETKKEYIGLTPEGEIELKGDFATIEGRINSVLQVPVYFETSSGQSSRGGNHTLLYIIVENPEGVSSFIEPYPEAIAVGKIAKISYRKLEAGRITTEEFIKLFVDKDCDAGADNYRLKADGIIVPDGIEYE